MSQDIQHLVDQLLLEQGEYQPLELLLQEGRLSYRDYEAWRSGELRCLDEALFGDPEQITQLLQQAADYLDKLGWQAQAMVYQPWQHRDQRALRFSNNSVLDHCFHQGYHKPQDQPQLDLFTDAPATSLVNGITHALINRNITEARRQLERLYDSAADHIRLGELECLVKAAENLNSDVDDVASELQFMHQTLIPLAESLLGKASRNLLIPLWRRLSNALQGQAYQPSQPELHISYTATQVMDWDTVKQSVEQEPHWQSDSVLLVRHATACDYLRCEAKALQDWFLLCCQYPEQGHVLESCSNQTLRQQWMSFEDMGSELPTQSFPAWLLIAIPGLTRILPEPDSTFGHDLVACPPSFHTLYRLQQNRLNAQGASTNSDDMELRIQLKQQDPLLFQFFLDRIAN